MIDVRSLRRDASLDAVRRALARRHDPEMLDQLAAAAALDLRLRELGAERDARRARVNTLSQEVGRLLASGTEGDISAATELQVESRRLGVSESAHEDEHERVSGALRQLLLEIPNVPHPDVPDGAGDADNPVVTGPVGLPEGFAAHQRLPHWETGAALGVLDGERAVKISGAMFSMQRGLGATMARALCQLALDRNADAFEEVRPPSLVSSATMEASGQLPKFADDAYHIERDDLWCSPTSEVPLTSLYAGETIHESLLPVKVMAATPCYRREAGAAGRDTRGMLRVHEFDKVEILAVCAPEQAPALLTEMTGRAERTIAALELAYRIVEICTGDLGQSHHRSFDLEVYAPGCDQWLEVSSVSWFGDYQARRADIRCAQGRAQGQRDSPHVERLGARRAAGVGGDPGAPPSGGRLGAGPRGAAPVHARAHRHRPDGVTSMRHRRDEYDSQPFDVDALSPTPLQQWRRWYDDAVASGATEPNAMTVATVDADGSPDARVVLVRELDDRGPVFYTSYHSPKSRQLDVRPVAAAVVVWLELHRQVRVRGRAERVSAEQSEAYFATRPRGSQIGAWASPQSDVLADRSQLVRLVADVEARFAGVTVPRPDHWGGWRIRPDTVEFWQGRRDRLHDRLAFLRSGDGWRIVRLAP